MLTINFFFFFFFLFFFFVVVVVVVVCFFFVFVFWGSFCFFVFLLLFLHSIKCGLYDGIENSKIVKEIVQNGALYLLQDCMCAQG